MCGIVGFTHKDRPASGERIREATATLLHRGPDQQGVFETPNVSLGAVRLKIIDLISGEQPMRSDDGDTVLVFNGEIYNYAEVREELKARGHRFASRSDTEVVLRAFLEWDTGCFARLRGMFGLALWTESRRRLVLARDRLGIKPLYYSRRGEDIYFASELKAIFVHPEVDRTIDLDGLNCYLRLNWVPAPHTLVRDIVKLLPGHFLVWEDGQVRSERYWRCSPKPLPAQTTLEEAKQQLDSLLQSSVKEHLVSDVPLGVWASGGIDSSTILHYAAAASPSRLKTFSITFKGRSFDESRYIREAAHLYGTDHTEFDLSPGAELVDAIQQFAYFSDEPSADAGSLPVWFLSKMSGQQVTVALSGEGADELFGGYLTYRADRYAQMARAVPALLRRAAASAAQLWPVSDDKISFEYKLKRFLEGSLLPPEEAHVFWNGTFSAAELRAFFLKADPEPMRRLLGDLPPGDGLDRFLLFDQRYYLPDDILYKVDRMSMAHSMEVRPPFLDHRIVEFAAALPESYKVRGSELKFILRELMKGKLPRSILYRKKSGFDIPAHDWFRGLLKPLLLDTVTEAAVAQTGLFRWQGIQTVIRDHLERRANLGYHLWGLLILFLWLKRWNIRCADSHETPNARARERNRLLI
ncbi:MAG: asparagine synthase (glutamine-hydrolyzing) [Terriglobales bacterium]